MASMHTLKISRSSAFGRATLASSRLAGYGDPQDSKDPRRVELSRARLFHRKTSSTLEHFPQLGYCGRLSSAAGTMSAYEEVLRHRKKCIAALEKLLTKEQRREPRLPEARRRARPKNTFHNSTCLHCSRAGDVAPDPTASGCGANYESSMMT